MKKILILCGESSSGKDTILKEIIKKYPDNYTNIVSCTDRPMRVGETNGEEYYFITKELMGMLDVVESRSYYPACGSVWTYALETEELSNKLNSGKVPIVILDLKGASELKGYLKIKYGKNIDITAIHIKTNLPTRFFRSFKRQHYKLNTVKEIVRRIFADKHDFKDSHTVCHFSISNNNGRIESVIDEINDIVMWDRKSGT